MTDKDTLIEKYLYSELSNTEAQQFEEALKNDSDFADEVELRTIIFAKAKSDFKKKLRDTQREYQKEKPTAKVVKLNPTYYLKRIAAALIIGVLAFVLYQYLAGGSPDQLVDNYLADTHSSPTVLMGDNDNEKAWQEAIKAYQSKDYSASVAAIQKIQAPDAEQQFYLGLSYLYNKNYEQAIPVLKQSLDAKNSFSESAQWYLSLAYFKNGQTDLARKYLNIIVGNAGWKSEEAGKLLKEIES